MKNVEFAALVPAVYTISPPAGQMWYEQFQHFFITKTAEYRHAFMQSEGSLNSDYNPLNPGIMYFIKALISIKE